MGRLEGGGNLVPWLFIEPWHYGSHEWDWGAYTQEVAKLCLDNICMRPLEVLQNLFSTHSDVIMR